MQSSGRKQRIAGWQASLAEAGQAARGVTQGHWAGGRDGPSQAPFPREGLVSERPGERFRRDPAAILTKSPDGTNTLKSPVANCFPRRHSTRGSDVCTFNRKTLEEVQSTARS